MAGDAPTIPDTELAAETVGPTQLADASVDDAAMPEPGYTIGDVIGRGGMGEVLVAHDRRIGRAVAIKRIRSDAFATDTLARFLREARIQARLEHPSIVPVYELGYDPEGRPFFTMKKITGVTLAARIGDGSALQPLLRAFADVCLAIEFAHERGVVHRDLKPHNIMLGDFGEVYVLDWGIARMLGDPARSEPTLPAGSDHLETKGLLGTPGYMSPEQIQGDAALGPPSDVYALGAILFEVLAGEPLHPRGTPGITTTLEGVHHGPLECRPDRAIPPELDVACLAALATDPAARPTARALAQLVQRYLDGDRDLEQRRTLAAQQLVLARAALATATAEGRATAMHHAGRALALAPESGDAAALLTTLILEPPREIPPALQRRIDNDSRAITARQSLSAGYTYAAYFLFLPMLFWQGVTNAGLAIVGYTLVAGMAIGAIWIGRTKRAVSPAILVLPNVLVVALLTRAYGPLLLAPGIAGATAMVLISVPELVERPVLVIGAMCSSLLIPMGLEAIGLIAPTWHVVDGAVVSTSAVMHVGGLGTEVTVVVGNLVMILVMGLMARTLARQRRDAVRDVEIQAWNLRQMVPLAPGDAGRAQ
ncbi:MAG: serine/threonine-protein kinase [Kofleriaceae bacterium]